jgi:hypothetical protein
VSKFQGQEELTSSTSGHPDLGPLRQKILQKHSAVPANTYVESIAGQARPLPRGLPVAVLTLWSRRDAIRWSGWQPE